jgi:hypothetical protein
MPGYVRLWKGLCLEHLEARELPAVDLRIATYNIGLGARPGIETVLRAIGDEVVGGRARPVDVLLLEEVHDQATEPTSIVNSLNAIYGAGAYNHGTVNGFGTDSDGGGPRLWPSSTGRTRSA